jgi:hypothetical protein
LGPLSSSSSTPSPTSVDDISGLPHTAILHGRIFAFITLFSEPDAVSRLRSASPSGPRPRFALSVEGAITKLRTSAVGSELFAPSAYLPNGMSQLLPCLILFYFLIIIIFC